MQTSQLRRTDSHRTCGSMNSSQQIQQQLNPSRHCRPARAQRRQVITQARSPRYDRRKPPPPDLPSLLFDQRIVYLGMPVSSVIKTCDCSKQKNEHQI